MIQNQHGPVSVIVPARNEEANIERLVRSLAAQDGVREILVVDDQSEDGTFEILQSLKAEAPQLRVLRVESAAGGLAGQELRGERGGRRGGGGLAALHRCRHGASAGQPRRRARPGGAGGRGFAFSLARAEDTRPGGRKLSSRSCMSTWRAFTGSRRCPTPPRRPRRPMASIS